MEQASFALLSAAVALLEPSNDIDTNETMQNRKRRKVRKASPRAAASKECKSSQSAELLTKADSEDTGASDRPEEMMKNLSSAFNDNDLGLFQTLLKSYAKDDMIVSSLLFDKDYVGLNILTMLWDLTFEAYPDATVSPIKIQKISRRSTEYFYNFVGTRITHEPVMILFASVMKRLEAVPPSVEKPTSADVSFSILKSVTANCVIGGATDAGIRVNKVCRAVYTFDDTGRICNMFLDSPL